MRRIDSDLNHEVHREGLIPLLRRKDGASHCSWSSEYVWPKEHFPIATHHKKTEALFHDVNDRIDSKDLSLCMPTIPTHLRSAISADGAALLDTNRGTLTTLNETGAFIWQAIERGESEGTIVAELAQATGESIQTVERDVQAFLDALAERKLIARCAGSTP